jgi:hypothetical protein
MESQELSHASVVELSRRLLHEDSAAGWLVSLAPCSHSHIKWRLNNSKCQWSWNFLLFSRKIAAETQTVLGNW